MYVDIDLGLKGLIKGLIYFQAPNQAVSWKNHLNLIRFVFFPLQLIINFVLLGILGVYLVWEKIQIEATNLISA